ADLPVKAKPVEYVKVCSLYGAGFFYIPGTDICLKIGGYVRSEWSYGYGQSMTTGPFIGASGLKTRVDGSADTNWRVRAYISMDTRQQTAYGTLRTYFNWGVNSNNGDGFNATPNANRAFIQFAGFTAGRATSFFDFYQSAATAYLPEWSSDSGDLGQEVFAYTAQLGNGVSATISAESPTTRRSPVLQAGATPTTGVTVTNFNQFVTNPSNAKLRAPDIVGNIRVQQAWGSVQVMAALHDVSGGYYSTAAGATGASGGIAANQNFGNPEDKWGWAVGAGLRLNAPMFGPGDYFQAQVAYSEGAAKYVAGQPSAGVSIVPPAGQYTRGWEGGSSFGYGIISDGVYGGSVGGRNATDVQLTTAWGVAAAYEHFWTPSLRTSVHGGYFAVTYNATANAYLCGAWLAGVTVGNNPNVLSGTCNNDYSMWQIGSRSQWNVTKDLYLGVDAVYMKLNTASAGATANLAASSASGTAFAGTSQPAGVRTFEDKDAVAVRFRVHRDILP
ncbi:MAG: porin, partial [Xanthobacteraceae bacterium]|nr:porin [Xanthobacteraceae bacterium]